MQEIDWQQEGDVVLPPLPEIPANATLEITYYGPISVNTYRDLPKVEVSATGIKSAVRWIVPDLYHNIDSAQNLWGWFYSALFTGLLMLALVILLNVVRWVSPEAGSRIFLVTKDQERP